MLSTLFSFRVRAKLLTALFLSPGTERNAWELAQSMNESYSAVWKELNRLERIGILRSEQKGNSKAYQVNPACPIAPELRAIILKTEGIGQVIQPYLQNREDVQRAFIYGSFASGKADPQSDIDLMIIGQVRLEELSTIVSEVEKELNRPINYVIFSEKEWREKLENDDPFAVNVEHAEKVYLVGGEDAL